MLLYADGPGDFFTCLRKTKRDAEGHLSVSKAQAINTKSNVKANINNQKKISALVDISPKYYQTNYGIYVPENHSIQLQKHRNLKIEYKKSTKK